MIDFGSLAGRITLEDTATSALMTFQRNLKDVGQGFSRAGSALSIGITAPLVAAAGASLLFSGNFEATTQKMVSLAGVQQHELEGVRQKILSLAPAVGIGPQALADAMMKISSTVSNTKTALEILEVSAKGSAAGLGEAVDVAGALTAVLNSYGKQSLSAAAAADVLTKAVQDGGAEARELAPTLANVVPIAAQLGVSFEEVSANIATVTKLGVPANEAVTQLSAVFTALLKETKQGGEALATVGMSFEELRKQVKEKGLSATLIDLTHRFGENKTGLTDVFGRVEALRNVMSSAGQQAETYAMELERMNEAAKSGTTLTQAFDAMQGRQLQTWSQVTAAVQVLAIKLGDSLAPAMGSILRATLPLVTTLGDLAKWFGDLPGPIQTITLGVLALAAAIGPVLFTVGTMATGISSLLPLLGLTATAGTAAGAGLVTAGAGAATAAPAITALGVAMKLLTGISVAGLFIALGAALWQVGEAVVSLWNAWQNGGSMWEFFSKKEDDNFVRRWAGFSSGVKEATTAVTEFVGPLQFYQTAEESLAASQAKGLVVSAAHTQAVKDLAASVITAGEQTAITTEAFHGQALAVKLSSEAAAIWLPKLDAIIASGRTLTQEQREYYQVQTTSRINTELAQTALLGLQGVTLTYIDSLRARGETEKEIAAGLGTTVDALKRYVDQLSLVEAQVHKLTDLEIARYGTASDAAIEGFNRTYEAKVRLLDAGTAAGAAAIAREAQIRSASIAAEMIDLDGLRKIRISTRQEEVAKAQATLNEMLLNSRDYYRDDIDAARENVRQKIDALRGIKPALKEVIDYSKMSEEALISMANSAIKGLSAIQTAALHAAGAVHTLAGEWITAKEAQDRMDAGGSSEIRSLTTKEFTEAGGKSRIAQLENNLSQSYGPSWEGYLARQRDQVLLAELKKYLAEHPPGSPMGTVGPTTPPPSSGGGGGGAGTGGAGGGGAVGGVRLPGTGGSRPPAGTGGVPVGGGLLSSQASYGPNVTIYVNGTAEQVAQKIKKVIMDELKTARQFPRAG